MFKKRGMDLYEEDQYEEEMEDEEPAEDEEDASDDEIEEDDGEWEDTERGTAGKRQAVQDRPEDEEDRGAEEESGEAEQELSGETQEADSEGKSARRIARRKRRIRNQIIAYAVMLVIVAGLIFGAVLAGKQLIRFVDSRKQTEEPPQEETPQDVVEVNAPTTTPEPEPTPEVNPVDEVAWYYINQMTTEEKVAGLFFVTPESMMEGVSQAVMAGGKTQEALDRYAVGGIIYFGQNIQSRDQITDMLAGTQEMSRYPLFFGVDEEGGTVARVADALSDVENPGGASELGASGDSEQAYQAYYAIGSYLAQLGFNVDFAPVADIYDGSNQMFAERSFGTDADTVAAFAYQAVSGLQDNGISACVKHFPGHGGADADSHDGMAVDEATEEELLASDVAPFTMALSASPDFVMVSHVSLPNILADNTPASMSSDIVTRILRGQLGYDGIVITDAMDMGAVTDYYTSAEAAVNAINAGCDMILKPDNFAEAYQGVLDAVNSGEIPIDRIEQSLLRIYRVKCAGMTLADVPGALPAEEGAEGETPAEGQAEGEAGGETQGEDGAQAQDGGDAGLLPEEE